MSLFLGLMSGTSLDGIDGVAVHWPRGDAPLMQVQCHVHRAFDARLREQLLALNEPADNELEVAGIAATGVARAYADVVDALIGHIGVSRDRVRAIGAHGQTVRHYPQAPGGGFSIQLLNGALLAETSGIDVV